MKHWHPELGVLVFLASTLEAQTSSIVHQPVACAVAEKFPRFQARFSPADTLAVARVLFQGDTKDWYSVTMKAEGPAFAAVLPKPKKSLKTFRYYIEVTDKSLGTSRTAEYTTSVVGSAGECSGRVMAATMGSASVLLQGPAGVAALPGGFASSGVVAGSAAGSGAAGAAGASGGAAGGGLGATALVVGGLAVAGGAVAVGAAKGGDDASGDSSNSATSPSSLRPYSVSFLPSPPGIDVSVCAGRSLTWGGQNVGSADANGNFNETWAPNEPNTARITGQVTSTTFQATLACTNGARSGTISATGSNGSYTGTFEFGSSRGQVTITRLQ